MHSSKYSLGILLLAATFAPSVFADGLMRDGIGAISTGRAGVNLAYADNGAVLFDNPAGMTNVAGTGLFDLSLDTVICNVDYSDLDNPNANASINGYPLGMASYIRRDPCSRWAWGIGAFVPAGFGAGYDLNSAVGPDTEYMSLGALGKLLPGIAYQVNDRLSIGGTFGLAISHVELEGPFYTTAFGAGLPAVIDLQGTGAAPTGSIGLQYKVTPNTVIGLSYTEETRFEFDGTARAQIGPLATSWDSTIELEWPRSLGIGVMHNVCCCSRVGFDVVWYDWSSAFNELPITLRNPTNPVVGGLLGNSYTEAYPLNWNDSVSYRFAYEWSPTDDLTWRAGYTYHNSPVPDSTLNPYLDGVLEHVVALGVSRCIGHGWLNLAYQYSWSPERVVIDSEIVGDDFDNSTMRAQAHWISAGYVRSF